MKKSYLINYLAIIAFMLVFLSPMFTATVSGQVTITQWDFNAETLIPTVGTGTAENVGGTNTSWAAGVTGNPDRGWNTSLYPAQGSNSGTAGVQFTVSTADYNSITVYWDHRHSNTSANRIRLQYTLNGTAWINFNANENNAVNTKAGVDVGFDNGRYIADAGDAWFVRSADFGAISGANNNPAFAVRIVAEFVDGTNYGAANATSNYAPAGTWRFDNVTISGTEISGGAAVKLAVTAVNNGNSPTENFPFSVTVQAQDTDGLPANVTANTQVTLTKETGTGSFGGTLVGTINAGTNAVTFAEVTYNVAESGVSIKASATQGMTLTPGISATFQVLATATSLKFVNFPGNGVLNQPIPTFTVEARRPDNTVDNTYTGTITLTKQSGPGNVSGTMAIAAEQGVATFSDILFDATGVYTLNASASNLTSDVSPSINIIGSPSVNSLVLPQFINGNVPADTRIPFAFRASFSNLFPNSTYRFINQAVTSGDTPTANGAGNLIFVSTTGDFSRTTGPSFNTPGLYGEFTTDQNGNFAGWFMIETTGNARFTPGNHVFMRIRLNDGAGGTAAVHYLTLADSVKVIGYSQENDENYGTGIRANSLSAPKNFTFLYDNISGTGRPLFGTSIESIGIDFTQISQYAAFYREDVSGFDGAWGGIVPNVNPNGVRRIEERKLNDGGIQYSITSVNGMWYSTNTANPSGGIDNILVIDLTTNIPHHVADSDFSVYSNQGQIIIQTPTDEPINVHVTDVLGRQMLTQRFSGGSVYYLSHQLKTGAYIVNVNSAKGVFNTKILVR